MKHATLKRVLAMALTLCMVFSMCPVTAFAADVTADVTINAIDSAGSVKSTELFSALMSAYNRNGLQSTSTKFRYAPYGTTEWTELTYSVSGSNLTLNGYYTVQYSTYSTSGWKWSDWNTDKVLYVSVPAAEATVTAQNGEAFYYVGMSGSDVKTNIFNAIYQSSTPALTVNDVTIEVKGSLLGWSDVTGAGLATLTTSMGTGSECTVTVKIAFAGNDDYAATESNEVTVTLKDTRTTVSLADSVEVTYGESGMLAEMVSEIGTVPSNASYTVNLQTVTDDMLKNTAASDPTGSMTVTVASLGDSSYNAFSKEVTVTFTGVYYNVPVEVSMPDGYTGGGVNNGATSVKAYYGQETVVTVDAVTGCNPGTLALKDENGNLTSLGNGSYKLTDVNSTTVLTLAYATPLDNTVVVNGATGTIGDNSGTQFTVSADTTVTVVLTPAEGKYISEVKLGDDSLEPTYANGKATVSFAVGQGNTYNLNVSTADIITVPDSITVNYNEDMDAADVESALRDKLTVASGVNKSDIEVEYLYTVPVLGTEVWLNVDETYGTISFPGDGVVRFTYNGNGAMYGADVDTTNVTVEDNRPTAAVTGTDASVNLYKDGSKLTYDESAILSALKVNVSDGNTEIANVAATITYIKEADTLLPQYALSMGTKDISAAGTYTIKVKFSGNASYKESEEVTLTLTVVDNRYDTSITLNDGTYNYSDFSKNVDLSAALTTMGFAVDSDEDHSVSTDDITVVVTDADGKTVAVSAMEAGKIYTVTASYEGDGYNKPVEGVSAELEIIDNRIETAVNLKENQTIPYTANDTVTEEEAYNLVFESVTFESVTNVTDYAYASANVTITDGDGNEVSGDIAAVGTYYITVWYPGSNTHKPSFSMVSFTVTDGRNVTKVNLTKADVPYDFDNGLTEEKILEVLNVSVVDVTDGDAIITRDRYTVTFKQGGDEIAPADMEVGQTYTIIVEYAGNDEQLPVKLTETFDVVDGRPETTVNLKADQTIAYSPDLDAEDILALVFDSITAGDVEVTAAEGTLEIEVPETLNVGTHTAKVSYKGDNSYKASSAEVTFEVTKATASVSVGSETIHINNLPEGGYDVDNLITVTPENVEYIRYAVGLSLGDNASADASVVAHVDIPMVIDIDALREYVGEQNVIVQAILNPVVDKLEETLDNLGNGSSMSISELYSTLTNVLNVIDSVMGNELAQGMLESIGINLNTESIQALVSALEAIQDIEGIDNVTVYLTMNKGIHLDDSGFYLVGAVTSDSNYNTAYGVNYLIITPDGIRTVIDWEIPDENGFFAIEAIKGNPPAYDLGAKVVSVANGNVADAESHLVEVFFGVDINGNVTLITDQNDLEIGAYTEIAFIRDLGNTMYYAEPIIRPVIVVADLVDVKFIDVNENNARLFTYDGQPHGMEAEAYDRAGNLLGTSATGEVKMRYVGIESDGELYNSTEAPTATGTYTVIATYVDDAHTKAGIAIGALVIQPADATITVTDLTVEKDVEDGTAVNFVDAMITSSPDDAKRVVILAGLNVSGDFSENGLEAVEGVVYVDFPTRVDEVLKNYGIIVNESTLTAADFLAKVDDLTAALENAGFQSDVLDQVVAQIKQLPSDATLAVVNFGEGSAYNPSSIGAYLVVAGIMDPDYKPTMDTGVLLITPKLTEAELKWNYGDENGIITRPILEDGTVDLGASAWVEGEQNADATEKIHYIIVGVTDKGETVTLTGSNDDADFVASLRNLENGVYTQIAYIPTEIDDEMTYGNAIMRQIILAPTYVVIEVESDTQVYDGTPKSVEVNVTDASGEPVVDATSLANLTVTYVGLGTNNEVIYNSTTPPTDTGVYSVIASYKEYNDETGELICVGYGVGTLTITPAELDFAMEDTTVCYDGEEHMPTTTNTMNATTFTVIIDENDNVNILIPEALEKYLPEDWDKDLSVQYWLNLLKNGMSNVLPEEVQNSDDYKALIEALEGVKTEKLTVNGAKPTELGVYDVYAVAIKSFDYEVIADHAVLTIREHKGGEPVKENVKIESCKEGGSYDEVVYCEYCNEELSRKTVTVDPAAHTPGEAVKENEVAATCEEDGSYDEVIYCDVCHEELSRTTKTVEKLGHDMGAWYVVTEATATKDGLERRDCSRCDYYETRVIPATGTTDPSDPSTPSTPSTPTTPSEHEHDLKLKHDDTYHWYECKCDHVEGKEKHTFGDWVTLWKAGKYTKGKQVHECTVCGYKEYKDIPATSSPTTGDNSFIYLSISVMVFSAAALLVVLLIRKKKLSAE